MTIKGKISLLHDDDLSVCMLGRSLQKEGYSTRLLCSSDGAAAAIHSWQPDALLLNMDLGPEPNGLEVLSHLREKGIDFPVIMLTAEDTSATASQVKSFGVTDYLTKPFNLDKVKLLLEKHMATEALKNEAHDSPEPSPAATEPLLLGESQSMRAIYNKAQRMARSGVQSFLLTGKSGTGKEVLARNIHSWQFGQRKADHPAPYIAINCTALPENLIESELFGHEKGAFTDAKFEKQGVFELANGGTLLLDEIGDMRAELQGKLLRALEERCVRRIGGKVDLPININIIASTNKDLKKEVENGNFREDLYYRLNSFALHLPELKDRDEDVILLAQYFLKIFTTQYGKKNIQTISAEAADLLKRYCWPGNVRELRNTIEHGVVMEEQNTLNVDNLPLDIEGNCRKKLSSESEDFQVVLPEGGVALEDVERELLRQALEQSNNNMSQGAKLLQVSYDTFRYKVKKYQLA